MNWIYSCVSNIVVLILNTRSFANSGYNIDGNLHGGIERGEGEGVFLCCQK